MLKLYNTQKHLRAASEFTKMFRKIQEQKLSINTLRGKHLFKTFPQFVQEVPPSVGQENLNDAQRCRISRIFISVMKY